MRIQIKPVAVYPSEANFLYLRPCAFGPPPSFYYELQNVTPGPKHKAKPAVGSPGEPDFTPAVAAYQDPEKVVSLTNGNVDMTAEQWNDWEKQPDTPYMLACALENLKLTAADV